METIQILLIIASIFLSIAWFGFRRMCPNCHRWNGLKRINSAHERDETRYRTETKSTTKKDKYGRITGSYEKQESVPYNVSYYKVTFRCKSCNQQVQRTIRNGKYLKESAIVFILSLILLFIAFKPNVDFTNPVNTNSAKSQNNTPQTITNNSQDKITGTKDLPTKKKIPVDSKPETKSKPIENDIKIEVQTKEVQEENQKSVQEKLIISQETPEYVKMELATKMLAHGKRVDEIADSTFLTKKEIRKLKRNLNKNR